jgi:hypothetical protein
LTAPLKVFLCHAHADRDPVRALYSRLTKDGVDSWLSSRSPKGLPRTEQGISIPLLHAHADRDPVRALYTCLTKDGVDAWFDKEKLIPGQDWELEIRKAKQKRPFAGRFAFTISSVLPETS